eukprot:m.391333 g.391333  ORF g.391333 m.391333 type:complete len:69 (+) comp21074_c0_seq9:1039-1245(+)
MSMTTCFRRGAIARGSASATLDGTARRAILAMQRPETTPGVSFDSQQRLEQLDHVGTDSHDTVSPNGL